MKKVKKKKGEGKGDEGREENSACDEIKKSDS